MEKVVWVPGEVMVADVLTKRGVAGYVIMNMLQSGQLPEELFKLR